MKPTCALVVFVFFVVFFYENTIVISTKQKLFCRIALKLSKDKV